MVTNPTYKNYANQIAELFCPNDPICKVSVYERLINNFNNNSFSYLLQNVSTGRFNILEYSNWRSDPGSCRKMFIDVKLTDAITGQIKTGYWYYDNADCGSKQYHYPDLNNLIARFGNTLIDPPITSKINADIKKPRLVHTKNAISYGITYVPPTVGGGTPGGGSSGGGGTTGGGTTGGGSTGGGGGIFPTPKPAPTPAPGGTLISTPSPGGFDLKSLLENPIVLIGGAVLLFILLKDKL